MTKAPSIAEMMSAYAQDAVEYAQRSFDIPLDYSEGSVQQVEPILAKLLETIPKGAPGKLFTKGPSQHELDQMTKMFGGYVGEVISLALGIVRKQAESLGLPYTTTGASGTPGLKWAGADSPWQGTVPTVLEGAGENNWPAALSEVAFLTNPDQQQLLSGATYRQQAAMAISGAITRFFGPP